MMKRILSLFTVLAMLLSCAAFAETATETATLGTATVMGFGGEISVSVQLENGEIVDVVMIGDGETPGIGSKIIDEWPLAFVEYNGIVDTYTGATFAGVTREAVIAAAREALANAGVNPDDYMREMGGTDSVDLTYTADIVVIGAGGAGMTAALDRKSVV